MNNYKLETVYGRILKKFENGEFTYGTVSKLPTYYICDDIADIDYEDRTPSVCCSIINYGTFRLSDVPEESMTREFFIEAFTIDEVFEYIREHIDEFDSDLLKDLLMSNKHSTYFARNCFEIMPVEYIDEEMCSLGIIKSTDWAQDTWFMSVIKRKPEALTADLWKLGARLYAREHSGKNRFLEITPLEFRDEEYYREMCSCNYNAGMVLENSKGRIMDTIPQEVITPEFLLILLSENMGSIARFNEKALETMFTFEEDGKTISEKVWKYMLLLKGAFIRDIPLNDERVEFFLNHYDEDSFEYNWAFKDKYKKYLREKEVLQQDSVSDSIDADECSNEESSTGDIALSEFEYDKSFAYRNIDVLPIAYSGCVPLAYREQYDNDEYLVAVCNHLGIEILEEFDNTYEVALPVDWKVCSEGRYLHHIVDESGELVITYFYDENRKKEPYVKEIYRSLDIQDDSDKGSKVYQKVSDGN